MKLLHQFSATLLTLSTFLLLTACNIIHNRSPQARSVITQSPSTYLQQAEENVGDQKQTSLLQATAAYFYYGQFAAGRKILYQIPKNQLSEVNKAEYQLLNSRLALHDQQAKRAIGILKALTSNPVLTSPMKIETLQLQAIAQQQLNLPVDSIMTRIQLTSLLAEPAMRDKNQRKIWRLLATVPTETLTTLQQSDNMILQGWAALALITRQYVHYPQQLLQQLQNWQNQFTTHPAKSLVLTDISKFSATLQTPQQIALLLPLHGPVKKQAEAILNGFLSAYYRARNQNLPTPRIKIYDTTTENIVAQYQKALATGAQFVIGPLTKANVQLLKLHGHITVPTLALNYDTDGGSTPNHLYEFALSPENETVMIAKHAAQLNDVNATIITPNGKWGTNIANVFVQQWQMLGGKIINTLNFSPDQHLKTAVAALLNIDQSYLRRNAIQNVIAKKVEFSARRRQDIDVIFLNAFPQNARQIMPLLRFYYAGNIPVFATSQIYQGIPNPQHDRDLDGIQFPIMPWAINPSATAQQLRQQAKQLWPVSFKQHSLLYAFGADAYTLMARMEQLQALAKFGISANTGILFIDNNRRIHRQLEWAEFKKGTPVLISRNDTLISLLQHTS